MPVSEPGETSSSDIVVLGGRPWPDVIAKGGVIAAERACLPTSSGNAAKQHFVTDGIEEGRHEYG